jgi:hypothetical protein
VDVILRQGRFTARAPGLGVADTTCDRCADAFPDILQEGSICESRIFFHVRTMRSKRRPERYRRNDPAGDPDRYESAGQVRRAPSSFFRQEGRAHADFSGIQSVCSGAVAKTHRTGKPDFPLR